jgi:hypothetical protein
MWTVNKNHAEILQKGNLEDSFYSTHTRGRRKNGSFYSIRNQQKYKAAAGAAAKNTGRKSYVVALECTLSLHLPLTMAVGKCCATLLTASLICVNKITAR